MMQFILYYKQIYLVHFRYPCESLLIYSFDISGQLYILAQFRRPFEFKVLNINYKVHTLHSTFLFNPNVCMSSLVNIFPFTVTIGSFGFASVLSISLTLKNNGMILLIHISICNSLLHFIDMYPKSMP